MMGTMDELDLDPHCPVHGDGCATCTCGTADVPTMSVWAVIFSNYEPAEVDSLWATEDLAERQAAKLDGHWGVEQWTIGTEDATP